ncbi:nucleotide exchange factor GrpE [Peptococcus simiae]|uniref:nucleotide exchange factor GrpE n=1 Tax=Peptococcus simiae TaxID=1643805 RepID=UPI0039801C05
MRDHASEKETMSSETEAPAEATAEKAEDVAEATAESGQGEENPSTGAETPELENRYIRLLADFDNYKRRTQREKADIYQYANESLIKEILPVLDAFDMALQTAPSSDDDSHKSVMTGLEQIQRQLMTVLEGAGLSRIAGLGESYDPVYHEAIMVDENADAPANTIIDELRTGYQFKDKVLRPTVCRVSGTS